jgi:uncharacterized protein YndB with AHSA1/START domain
MKKFSTSTTIHAPPETVWSLLTDAPSYPRWNPTVERIEGEIAQGRKITVHTTFSKGRAFPAKVTEFSPLHRMVWSGGMPLGLFKGVRTFTLTPRDGAVEFSMEEVFSGLMSPLIEKSIPDLDPYFAQFAEGLKKAAEGSMTA